MQTIRHFRLPVLLIVLLGTVLPTHAQNIVKTPQPTPTPETTGASLILDFSEHDANVWEDWVDVLTENDLIDGDGELVLEGEMLSTALTAPFIIFDESESDYRNFAGGGLVSFRPDDQTNNLCGYALELGSIPEEGTFENLVVISVNAFDEILVLNITQDTDQADWLVADASVPDDVFFHNPNYFHFVLNDGHITIFVNGISVISDFELELSEPADDDNLSSSFVGTILEFSCVMTDVWVYGFE